MSAQNLMLSAKNSGMQAVEKGEVFELDFLRLQPIRRSRPEEQVCHRL